MNKEGLLKVINQMADCMEENKQYLTLLDTEIGDADHGINMARGFASIRTHMEEFEGMSMGDILTGCGKILIHDVAGSSGPLYGSAFKCAGKVIADSGGEEITVPLFYEMLQVGIEKIQKLGRAVEGEKTMLDAMFPALRALEGRSDREALKEAAKAAAASAERTREYQATKGRASYVLERSIGHADPGAVSFSLLMGVIADSSKRTFGLQQKGGAYEKNS